MKPKRFRPIYIKSKVSKHSLNLNILRDLFTECGIYYVTDELIEKFYNKLLTGCFDCNELHLFLTTIELEDSEDNVEKFINSLNYLL